MKKIFFISFILSLVLFSCTKEIEHSTKIKVGVFNGNGASEICVIETLEALKIDTGITGFEISSADIINGKLDSIDVLIFPGGSGSKELNNLGDFGVQKIQDFVKEQGKGIVGICAGAYLLSTTPTYPSLELLDAYNYDRENYARGRGLIEIEMTDAGLEIFPELKDKRAFIQYYDGPILVPTDSSNIKITEFAKYVTDIHSNAGTPEGVTPGKTFILTENIGNGKVITIGGHPESTPGMRWMVSRMVRYVHKNELISYNTKWIRPEINSTEIMFTSELKKTENSLFWQLLNDTAEVRLNAMIELNKLRSRPAVRWTIGMLRDNSPEVRKQAAIILKETEYTWALPDLLAALKTETNSEVKKQLQETIDFLSQY